MVIVVWGAGKTTLAMPIFFVMFMAFFGTFSAIHFGIRKSIAWISHKNT